jgi:TonB family protein
MLPGPNCKSSRTESFVDGRQPGRACDKCQPEHKSRLADHADARLIRDATPSVPSSVPEGLRLRVEIIYTVTAKGDVTDVEVTKSSGYRALDQAVARSATREWKYEPAVQDGIPRSSKKTRGITVNT